MIVLDGKNLFEKIKKQLSLEVNELILKNHRPPHLVAILVGDNAASLTYVNAKIKACQEIKYKSSVLRFPSNITERELLSEIEQLNHSNHVDGIIVQLPLPSHIDEHNVTHSINYKKDVDGFHPINVGRMTLGLPCFFPATPFGIISLLKEYKIKTKGKHCLIIGRSNIVGTPMSILLSRNSSLGNATVTLAHSHTKNLTFLYSQADIIIVAVGQPEFLKYNKFKENVVIIDVGIHRVPSVNHKSGFKLVGDVDFDSFKNHVSYITPVPGGVGPMTIASLLKNTLLSAKKLIYS